MAAIRYQKVVTTSDYTEAATVRAPSSTYATGADITVSDVAAMMQTLPALPDVSGRGYISTDWTPEERILPRSLIISDENIAALRFRNAVSGKSATIDVSLTA